MHNKISVKLNKLQRAELTDNKYIVSYVYISIKNPKNNSKGFKLTYYES